MAGHGQEAYASWLSDSSLPSGRSGAASESVTSTPSKKHVLEVPSEGSPQLKRRLPPELNGAATPFRYSAPCVQSSLHAGDSERHARGAPTMRDGAGIPSLPTEARDSAVSSKEVNFDRIWGVNCRMEEFPVLVAKESVPASSMGSSHHHPKLQTHLGAETSEGGGAGLDAGHILQTVRKETAKEVRSITMCGDRPYSDWAGEWGRSSFLNPFFWPHFVSPNLTEGAQRKIPGVGALFPEGYLPRVGDPLPWICPVRDCQTVFANAWALGGHFSVC